MIYVEMAGRCGNQLFHYACARFVQIKTGDNELILNFNSVFAKNRADEGWYDCLTEYKTVPYKYYNKTGTVIKNETNFVQKVLCGLKLMHIAINSRKNREGRALAAAKFQHFLNVAGVYWIREGVTKIHPYSRKKMLVTGVCEAGEIFAEIADTLKQELQPKSPVPDSDIELMERILSTESVCVSVRRGDFFNNNNVQALGVCTPEYYTKAADIMGEKLKTPLFFIFSDDIEWCRSHIKIRGGGIYVSQDKPVCETLRLMYSCKNFILSNSTFSWWGQFLSRNEKKIVISPSRWNNEGYHSRLIDKSWILVEV